MKLTQTAVVMHALLSYGPVWSACRATKETEDE